MWGNRGACEAAVAVIFDETADGRRYLSTKGAKGHQEGLKRDLSFYPFELFVVEKQFTVATKKCTNSNKEIIALDR